MSENTKIDRWSYNGKLDTSRRCCRWWNHATDRYVGRKFNIGSVRLVIVKTNRYVGRRSIFVPRLAKYMARGQRGLSAMTNTENIAVIFRHQLSCSDLNDFLDLQPRRRWRLGAPISQVLLGCLWQREMVGALQRDISLSAQSSHFTAQSVQFLSGLYLLAAVHA